MPQATRVSRAILFDKSARAALSSTLSVIDSVHGDGPLPPLPVRLESPPKLSDRGIYNFREVINGSVTRYVAQDILIQQATNQIIGVQQELSFVHEIGHFIDQQGWNGNGWASANSPELASWREAAEATAAIQELRRLQTVDTVIVPHASGMILTVPHTRIDYLLRWQEIWARAYSQYIAVQSNDPVLMQQLNEERIRFSFLPLPRQWNDADFAPVADAITALFEQRGWL